MVCLFPLSRTGFLKMYCTKVIKGFQIVMQFPIHYQLHVFTKVNYEAQYQTTETEREECDVCFISC